MALSVVLQHLIDSVRAGVAEMEGNETEATRLRAQCKLRLVNMSDEEIWELADITCQSTEKTTDEAYTDFKKAIEYYKATTNEWLKELSDTMSGGFPK